MRTLGQLIKNARLERRYTLQESANITGISRMTLYRIENDEINALPVKMLHHICNVYQIGFFEAMNASRLKINSADLYSPKNVAGI